MTSIYDSCKGVSSPSTGGLLLETVCGSYGATYCSAERYIFPTHTSICLNLAILYAFRLFEYLGNIDENVLTPFRMYYIPTENDTDALNRTTFACNEAYDVRKLFMVNILVLSFL